MPRRLWRLALRLGRGGLLLRGRLWRLALRFGRGGLLLRGHLFGALFALAAGCRPSLPASFICQSSGQCVFKGAQGTCEPTRACSFPDASCASGRRYGHYAPDHLADRCVELADADGGAPDLAPPLSTGITRVGQSELALSPRAQALTLPVPAGLKTGDLLFVALFAGTQGASFSPPAGWTTHASFDGGPPASYRAVVLQHRALATEPADFVFPAAGTDTAPTAAVLVAYRGVGTPPIDATQQRRFAAMPLSAPSVTTQHANDMLVALFVDAAHAVPLQPPSGLRQATSAGALYAFDGLQPQPGDSGDKTVPNVPLGVGAVDLFALAPAP